MEGSEVIQWFGNNWHSESLREYGFQASFLVAFPFRLEMCWGGSSWGLGLVGWADPQIAGSPNRRVTEDLWLMTLCVL